MASAGGFYRGTTHDQMPFFANKEKKMLSSKKWPEYFNKCIDTSKVRLDVIKNWVTARTAELNGTEDDILIDYCMQQLSDGNVSAYDATNSTSFEATKVSSKSQSSGTQADDENKRKNGIGDEVLVDPRSLQINLSGFMDKKNLSVFMRELILLLLSAQENELGIPKVFIENETEEINKSMSLIDKMKEQEVIISANIQSVKSADKSKSEARQKSPGRKSPKGRAAESSRSRSRENACKEKHSQKSRRGRAASESDASSDSIRSKRRKHDDYYYEDKRKYYRGRDSDRRYLYRNDDSRREDKRRYDRRRDYDKRDDFRKDENKRDENRRDDKRREESRREEFRSHETRKSDRRHESGREESKRGEYRRDEGRREEVRTDENRREERKQTEGKMTKISRDESETDDKRVGASRRECIDQRDNDPCEKDTVKNDGTKNIDGKCFTTDKTSRNDCNDRDRMRIGENKSTARVRSNECLTDSNDSKIDMSDCNRELTNDEKKRKAIVERPDDGSFEPKSFNDKKKSEVLKDLALEGHDKRRGGSKAEKIVTELPKESRSQKKSPFSKADIEKGGIVNHARSSNKSIENACNGKAYSPRTSTESNAGSESHEAHSSSESRENPVHSTHRDILSEKSETFGKRSSERSRRSSSKDSSSIEARSNRGSSPVPVILRERIGPHPSPVLKERRTERTQRNNHDHESLSGSSSGRLNKLNEKVDILKQRPHGKLRAWSSSPPK